MLAILGFSAALVVASIPPDNGLGAERTSGDAADDVEDVVAEAEQAIIEGRYIAAAQAYARAYALQPRATFLYARAHALRLAGDCRAAIAVFETFVEQAPPAQDVEDARGWIAACEQVLAAQQGPSAGAPAPATSSAPPPRAVVEAPPPLPPSTRPWHRDPAGGALLGVGVVSTTVGASAYVAAAVLARTPSGPETEDAHVKRSRKITAASATGAAGLVTGAILIVGSVIRYTIVARQPGRRSTSTPELGFRF
jgi:hypothetical protein